MTIENGQQIEYNLNPETALAGQLATYQDVQTDAYKLLNGDLSFGYAAALEPTSGLNDAQPVVDVNSTFIGVAQRYANIEADSSGDVKYAQGKAMAVTKKGKIYVKVVDGVTPKHDEKVYVNIAVGAEIGKFTNVATDNIEVPGAKFKSPAINSQQVMAISLTLD